MYHHHRFPFFECPMSRALLLPATQSISSHVPSSQPTRVSVRLLCPPSEFSPSVCLGCPNFVFPCEDSIPHPAARPDDLQPWTRKLHEIHEAGVQVTLASKAVAGSSNERAASLTVMEKMDAQLNSRLVRRADLRSQKLSSSVREFLLCSHVNSMINGLGLVRKSVWERALHWQPIPIAPLAMNQGVTLFPRKWDNIRSIFSSSGPM